MSAPNLSYIRSRIATVPPKTTLNARWLLNAIAELTEPVGPGGDSASDESVTQKLVGLLELIIESKQNLRTVTAGDLNLDDATTVFKLSYDIVSIAENPWSLTDEPHDPPATLSQNLRDYRNARYDPNSECSCRVPVDFLLVSCHQVLHKLYPEHFRPPARGTSARAITPENPVSQLTLFPELELSIIVPDNRTGGVVRITGRADWAYGYGIRAGYSTGNVLVAIEAKQPETLSAGRAQLLTYLGVMRTLRQQAGKANTEVQGFFTDGAKYTFMSIRSNGDVEESEQLNILNTAGRKTIFNFVIAILQSAMKSTPSASPTKPTEARDREIGDFSNQVWYKFYKKYGITPPEFAEEDEDTMDLSGVRI